VAKEANKPVEKFTSARELLALNVIRLRHEQGWSQDALALEAGLDRTFVAHVERQKRNISLDNVERLALALGVSMSELFAT
jgi:transcriptional regulator with XRE-family HTH domain